MATGKFDAAFADERVVLFLEGFGKLVDARDVAGGENFFFGGFGTREGYVFANGAVKKKSFLQDDAELGAVGIQLDGGEIDSVDEDAAGWMGRRMPRSSR